jgi:NDP-sugar pyrophosphorylase family protein
MKTLTLELKRYSRRSDNSVSLTLDTLVELSSEEIAEIDRNRGNLALVVITEESNPESINVDMDKLLKDMPENDGFTEFKSPSKRLKGVIYVLQQQQLNRKPTEEEAMVFYKDYMEKFINWVKDKLS